MTNAKIKLAADDGSIFSDSSTNDVLLFVSDPSQVMRIGASKEASEGSPQLSSLSIDASSSSPRTEFHSPVSIENSLEVESNITITQGSLGIGQEATPGIRLEVGEDFLTGRRGILIEGGDLTVTNGENAISLSRAVRGVEEISEGQVRFTRGDDTSFDVQVTASGAELDELVEQVPPVGTLTWVMRGFQREDPTSKYLVADGSEVSQTEYPELFEIFGNTYDE